MSRTICGFVIIAVMLTASGCPVGSPIALGTWLFYLGDNGDSVAAIIFLPNGQTARPNPMPPQANSEFESGYVFTWAVEGSTFTLSQYPEMTQNPTPEIVATGTVESRRSIINGTLAGTSATWTARPL